MAQSPEEKLADRYRRIAVQLAELFSKNVDPISRMATAAAVLHHKLPHFDWTGFYRLVDGELLAGPYQGHLACSILARETGVCWHCVTTREAVVVPDVREFPGHIYCDARSLSEVVVPVLNTAGEIAAVLDVDSNELGAFSAADAAGLQAVAALIYGAARQ